MFGHGRLRDRAVGAALLCMASTASVHASQMLSPSAQDTQYAIRGRVYLSDSTHGIAWKGTAFKRANHLVLNVSSGTTALDADLIVSAEEGSIAGDIFVADAMVATFARTRL
ncbi:MAG TPA: hypothetical protein VFD92_26060 [Candidatus Binatia bacterium]|nr:hypothetical protein [Candidatus Binatia bacterium]